MAVVIFLSEQYTVKAAKTFVKRVHPKGGTIKGYFDNELVYQCVVMPQHKKGPEGRSVYSDRNPKAPEGTYPKPEVFTLHPEVYDLSRVFKGEPDAGE
jgi:hypothetical protein